MYQIICLSQILSNKQKQPPKPNLPNFRNVARFDMTLLICSLYLTGLKLAIRENISLCIFSTKKIILCLNSAGNNAIIKNKNKKNLKYYIVHPTKLTTFLIIQNASEYNTLYIQASGNFIVQNCVC